MSSEVVVVTCVTNTGGGMGPGHSAVAVGAKLYTFEALDYGGNGSGWLVFDREAYFSKNAHRPLLLQTIRHTAVCPHLVGEYVRKSIRADDDYIGSGVCSTQVAKALDAAMPRVRFEPRGFDTPYEVYRTARRLLLVAGERYLWPGRTGLEQTVKMRILAKLRADYPQAHRYFITHDRELAADETRSLAEKREAHRILEETRRREQFRPKF
jgi:hypothetical protein